MDEESGTKDVDCVLSTLEVEELIDKIVKDLRNVVIEEREGMPNSNSSQIFCQDLYTHQGGGFYE